MDDELKKILGGEPEIKPSLEPKKDDKKSIEAPKEDQELKAKQEQKANLEKAILEGNAELKRIRDAKKKAKTQVVEDDEEELPKINMEDPSAKAWDKHIQKNVAPVAEEMEKEKSEVRTFAIREFLKDRPSLAKDPEKLKQVMATYDRIKTSSERTREGVMTDLEKAYAAEYHEELISAARSRRVEDARNDAIFSDIAVSRGATTYSDSNTPAPRHYSEEEKAQLAKWGMTPAQHAEMEKEMKKKYG